MCTWQPGLRPGTSANRRVSALPRIPSFLIFILCKIQMTTAMANYQIATQKIFQRTITNDQINKKIQNVQNKNKRSSHCSSCLKSKGFRCFYIIQHLIKKAKQEKERTCAKFQIFQLQTNQTDVARFH